MYARYVTSVISGLLGGLVVVASQAFLSGTTAWLAFALGVGLLILAPLPALFGDRGIVGWVLDGVTSLLAIWTIIASLVFSGDVVKWLSFGEGAGFVLLALGGLTLNEVRLARRAHLARPVQIVADHPESVETARSVPVAA
jgi:hypothetical protein